MSVDQLARIVRDAKLPVTPQLQADLALQLDQERRAALKHGDTKRAKELEKVLTALLEE